MKKPKNHLDAVFMNQDVAKNISYRLNNLANAFVTTGNDRVAEKLFKIAEEIEEAAYLVSESFDKDQQERYNQTREHTANILDALTGGVEIGKKEKI